jgi:hypothetical protein
LQKKRRCSYFQKAVFFRNFKKAFSFLKKKTKIHFVFFLRRKHRKKAKKMKKMEELFVLFVISKKI